MRRSTAQSVAYFAAAVANCALHPVAAVPESPFADLSIARIVINSIPGGGSVSRSRMGNSL
jgi:hypothetical protein